MVWRLEAGIHCISSPAVQYSRYSFTFILVFSVAFSFVAALEWQLLGWLFIAFGGIILCSFERDSILLIHLEYHLVFLHVACSSAFVLCFLLVVVLLFLSLFLVLHLWSFSLLHFCSTQCAFLHCCRWVPFTYCLPALPVLYLFSIYLPAWCLMQCLPVSLHSTLFTTGLLGVSSLYLFCSFVTCRWGSMGGVRGHGRSSGAFFCPFGAFYYACHYCWAHLCTVVCPGLSLILCFVQSAVTHYLFVLLVHWALEIFYLQTAKQVPFCDVGEYLSISFDTIWYIYWCSAVVDASAVPWWKFTLHCVHSSLSEYSTFPSGGSIAGTEWRPFSVTTLMTFLLEYTVFVVPLLLFWCCCWCLLWYILEISLFRGLLHSCSVVSDGG